MLRLRAHFAGKFTQQRLARLRLGAGPQQQQGAAGVGVGFGKHGAQQGQQAGQLGLAQAQRAAVAGAGGLFQPVRQRARGSQPARAVLRRQRMRGQRVVQRQQGVVGVDHFVEEHAFQVQRAAGGAPLKPGFGVGAVGQRLAGALKVGGALLSG